MLTIFTYLYPQRHMGCATVDTGNRQLWKYVYYGDILPNTYYVKASFLSLEILVNGLRYIFDFLRSYSLILFGILIVFFM